MTNTLIALSNLIEKPITDIKSYYRSANRANSVGDALELYIKDLFCDTLNVEDINKKHEAYNEHFSYLGNQNNPPDIIIRGGDAIEVKKIESVRAGIALNSSYPKNKLHFDSPMITQACRDCESWREKDLLYVIGAAAENKLQALWFVYGDCYAADKEVYEKISNKISSGLHELKDIELSETNELGRVNKIDPLGITYLRVRGMWHIDNPTKVFDYLTKANTGFTVNALMLQSKYNSFPEEDRNRLEQIENTGLTIRDVKLKSPNNPAKLLTAKLIQFTKQ